MCGIVVLGVCVDILLVVVRCEFVVDGVIEWC